jgi:hypothetical protein
MAQPSGSRTAARPRPVRARALTGFHRAESDVPHRRAVRREEHPMSKDIDRKKETKKKPLHTKEEKRAMKREKKRLKGLM